MSLSAECHELLQSLAHTTAWLSGLDGAQPEQVARALAERSRAIAAIAQWIEGEHRAGRRVDLELAEQMTAACQSGTQFLLRLAIEREATRADLVSLNRELQILRGLGGAPVKSQSIDCRG